MAARRALPLLLVLTALAVASASASTLPPTDRSIKLDLIAKLKRGPQILVLGDSRGRQAEPSYLRRLTGRTGFNAAVMGGTAPDAWVFIRYTADRFPGQKRSYVWFVSAGLAGNIPDPRTEADPRGRHYLQEVAQYLDNQPLDVPWPKHPFTGYRQDGGLATKAWPPSSQHVARVKAEAAAIAANIRQKPPGLPDFASKRFRLFEHLLAYLNGRGERPVIVFNPLYPTVYAALERYDSSYLTGALDYLRSLRSTYNFVMVNCENVHACGGNDTDWQNATHVNRFNMQRMLRHIVAHSGSALR
jgi:anaerobic selenocysteine-containing dehydrogenase